MHNLRHSSEHESPNGADPDGKGRKAGKNPCANERGESAGAGGEREHAVGGGDEPAREGDAFGFVGVEQSCGGAAVQDVGEFPGEVDGVADAGVHALAADGAVDVGGVAEEEHAALRKRSATRWWTW